MAGKEAACFLKFQAVPGFFVDLAERGRQDPTFRATSLPSLGLIQRPYETDSNSKTTDAPEKYGKPWERFKDYIDRLNAQDSGATYKVLYITRHGLGYHNTFESKVGREAWNNYWSRLDGDGQIIWADAKLHEDGIQQAEDLSRFWSDAVSNEKIPLPETVYTSPLARCLETTRLAFTKTFKERGVKFQPIVKELLRELLTDHTCDRRNTRSWIEQNYPDYVIEPGFSDEDTLWTGGRWETFDEHAARKHQVLEEIFRTDDSSFIGLTTHSYAISAILKTVGLFQFRVREGSSIALLVKAEKINSGT